MADGIGLSVTDHDMSFAFEDGFDQGLNIWSIILIVPVGIDNDVCTQFQARVEAGLKRVTQTPVFRKSHNMVHAQFTGNLRGAIG